MQYRAGAHGWNKRPQKQRLQAEYLLCRNGTLFRAGDLFCTRCTIAGQWVHCFCTMCSTMCPRRRIACTELAQMRQRATCSIAVTTIALPVLRAVTVCPSRISLLMMECAIGSSSNSCTILRIGRAPFPSLKARSAISCVTPFYTTSVIALLARSVCNARTACFAIASISFIVSGEYTII